ncbi:MAG TPA: hypothetical protein VKD70_05455 [Candidatus Acidoferrum sp.]|nr:hypothetical protein [Candidatus Acidoferrum sp.]
MRNEQTANRQRAGLNFGPLCHETKNPTYPVALILDLAQCATQTENMAHIYLTFDFGKDEEKAQQARHKLDAWKQAFRLDKKMQGKFDRKEDGAASPVKEDAGLADEGSRHPQKAGQAAKGAKGKAKAEAKADPEPAKLASSTAEIRLILLLALPNHEKLTEQRLLKRISTEEPFASASPKTIREADAEFAKLDSRFQELE